MQMPFLFVCILKLWAWFIFLDIFSQNSIFKWQFCVFIVQIFFKKYNKNMFGMLKRYFDK